MLTQRNDTSFMTKECTPEKATRLAFSFKGTIIPPALPNRLISACLSMWTVKKYEGKQLLFSGFIGLSFDMAHDIVVCVEGNKILLYIVHKTSNGLIVPDIATGIKETMFTTLERISEFYQSAVHVSSNSQKLPFHVEYSCSKLECFITEETALTTDEWICDKHKLSHTNEKWNIWNQNQKKEQCEENCQEIREENMDFIPTDEILDELAHVIGVVSFQLGVELGLSITSLDIIQHDNGRDLVAQCKAILYKWRKDLTVKPTIEVLHNALVNVGKGSQCLEEIIKSKGVKKYIPEEEKDEVEKKGKEKNILEKMNHFKKKK
ncbi:unnamed protein product [Mytilus edulis]|uniref:Death domain-containing protein n=1 Tax=Mytilus edulis TaxID=6550 RepID=A0A8S3S1F5_MYTED|nr:unnamed protein product [Mytilus edulis]